MKMWLAIMTQYSLWVTSTTGSTLKSQFSYSTSYGIQQRDSVPNCVSTGGNAITSAHLSVSFHSNCWSQWLMTLTSCMCMGHNHTSPGIVGHGWSEVEVKLQKSRSNVEVQLIRPRSSIENCFLISAQFEMAIFRLAYILRKKYYIIYNVKMLKSRPK